jgi:hypothetical protein
MMTSKTSMITSATLMPYIENRVTFGLSAFQGRAGAWHTAGAR